MSAKKQDGETHYGDSIQPVKITPKIQINKIYGINTLNETYTIDGYFVASWFDERNIVKKKNSNKIIYENQVADEKIGKEIWVPAFEFINVVGKRNTVNKQLIIRPDGNVTYNERFNAVFTTSMDFKKFPFDRQCFSIQLEAFSYDDKSLVFERSNDAIISINKEMPEEWLIYNERKYVSKKEYSHLSTDGRPVEFSRYNIEINAKRKIRYYLWQFIFPLFLIISISWSVFWIPDLSDQLATNFTLMLTVVAFNFHTSNILPNLPYSTFIESLITIGYLSIFISILIIILGHSIAAKSKKISNQKLMGYCKYLFPCGFLLINIIQAVIFFG
ncbi:hypothetical protein [Flavivirga aquimarina]|uniref:hypothetical protein n=1 Tax=Flavivirga aquimarina TaxID=2027862 RepID=UPI0026E0F50F|nr:hypothetical protein [Flavivirga aquimarina]